jgi:hypothetical protein
MTFGAGGKVGVNIFMLISGYFLVNKQFKKSRLISFAVRTYVVAFFIVAISVVFAQQSIKSAVMLFLNPIFPFNGTGWWYITAYAVVLLLFPVINLIFENLSQKSMWIGILCSIMFMSVLPLFNLDTELPGATHGAVWMIVLYAIGGYLSKFNVLNKITLKQVWLALVVALSLMVGRFALILWQPQAVKPILSLLGWLQPIPWRDADPFLLIVAICIFAFAVKYPSLKMGKITKILAGETLAMYMLHNSNDFATKYRLIAHGYIGWQSWSGIQYVAFEIGMGILMFVLASLMSLAIAPIEQYAVKAVNRKLGGSNE